MGRGTKDEDEVVSGDAYLGAQEIRQLAESIGLTPTKKLGQNFVHDANTVRKIVGLARLSPREHVLEIGPGLGSLTVGLVAEGASVTAIEIDERLASLLPQTIHRHYPGAHLTVLHQDALKVREISPDITSVVANLPYNTSVPIVLHLLEIAPSVKKVLVMVQAEVAERLAASPGSKVYGAPSVKAAWYGRWSVAGSVSRQVFWPVPNVDSLLVSMEATEHPGDESLRTLVFELVDHAFATRRKMVRGALAQLLGPQAHDLIREAGLNPEDRGEDWSVQDFVALATVIRDHRS